MENIPYPVQRIPGKEKTIIPNLPRYESCTNMKDNMYSGWYKSIIVLIITILEF